ncbi:MAG: carboxymuconolactone decarboxylase family protein [Pseudomonadales bacterium]
MVDLATMFVARQELGAEDAAAIDAGVLELRVRLLAQTPHVGAVLRNVEAVLESTSTLGPTVREIVILTALRRSECEVKSRLDIARRRGVTQEMVEAILDEDWTDPAFNPAEKAAFQFALQYDAGHLINDSVLEAVQAEFDHAAQVEMAVLCGQYGAYARLSVGFRLDQMGA